jgi:hypothetical protein
VYGVLYVQLPLEQPKFAVRTLVLADERPLRIVPFMPTSKFGSCGLVGGEKSFETGVDALRVESGSHVVRNTTISWSIGPITTANKVATAPISDIILMMRSV